MTPPPLPPRTCILPPSKHMPRVATDGRPPNAAVPPGAWGQLRALTFPAIHANQVPAFMRALDADPWCDASVELAANTLILNDQCGRTTGQDPHAFIKAAANQFARACSLFCTRPEVLEKYFIALDVTMRSARTWSSPEWWFNAATLTHPNPPCSDVRVCAAIWAGAAGNTVLMQALVRGLRVAGAGGDALVTAALALPPPPARAVDSRHDLAISLALLHGIPLPPDVDDAFRFMHQLKQHEAALRQQ